MAAVSSGRSAKIDKMKLNAENAVDRVKKLYPAVNEAKHPLPRSWSTREKFSFIGLSQNNLRVHYKGHGKTHRDAASIQASHPIPEACGLYYFEVKIVSKGRDGYMGIGLSAQGVSMNRLPGWDKQSYGYHGDDGHSFCSSGTGQPYGPTFTTGDVIGCGVNLVDNTCFYTKNGHHLGIAFTDLPPNLYPTVGLQTPGEVVDANFGQEPFVFDIDDMIREMVTRTRYEINDIPIPNSHGEWQSVMNRIISSYLTHQGYLSTAEIFSHITETPFNEDSVSIKNRQKILKLVLAGRMGEAIERTSRLYPGLLEANENLLFMLKCRQFVEMVNGSDVEVNNRNGKKGGGSFSPTFGTSPRPGSPIQTSVIQSTKNYSANSNKSSKHHTNTVEEMMNTQNTTMSQMATQNGNCGGADVSPVIMTEDGDVEMDTSDEFHNGVSECDTGDCDAHTKSTNGYQNGNSHSNNITQDTDYCDQDEDMEVDVPVCRKSFVKPAVERILEFGKELYSMSQQLTVDKNVSENNQKMLEDAFSLLAYSNPWASPVGWQLQPSERESVCASLNSAILECMKKPRKPPLEMVMAHAHEVVRIMSNAGISSCAFASVVDILDQ